MKNVKVVIVTMNEWFETVNEVTIHEGACTSEMFEAYKNLVQGNSNQYVTVKEVK